VKIDTEKYPDLASRFNIHALPTLVLFKDGKVAERIVSLIPFQLIEK
jgi:thioredoxin-like negative regulator of GroEL